MVDIIGVRFKKVGKIYFFDPDNLDIPKGTPVIVETARGIEFGYADIGRKSVEDEKVVQPLKKVIRIATEADSGQKDANAVREAEAFQICKEKIKLHDMKMKLVEVEITFDQSKIIFYFSADGRVDFRELVKELAAVFRVRIEMRQIGVRDEAKIINGIGICGRALCCATFLGDFQPVSIKMAKEQSLSLNPTKISGICGRLMCCLKYEEETYELLNQDVPMLGDTVRTPDGDGEILSVNVLRQIVKVAVRNKPNDAPVVGFYHLKEIKTRNRVRSAEPV